MKRFCILLYLSFFLASFANGTQHESVTIREGTLTLPTYALGVPEKAPSFMRHFAYQRAKRSIYPYPLCDRITNERNTQAHKALFLDTEFVELCVLPEIGGRLFYAIDKTNGYDIFYHQHVIKPSNVGMLGAWISGGVEFNAFHHHRASSHLPVNYRLISNTDGSKTIWIGETEPRHRMAWSIGLTLHPGKSYIEVSGRLINCTQNKNSFLYWSNVSTGVNEDYQILFPESTEFGVYHAKNSFCHWPLTHEVFDGKTHYQKGIDASWWKNHPDPVSIFAYDLQDDFIAGYDHGKQAGTMLVGNHNIVKGGKLWEWGPGAYGSMWDTKVLTDNDGPYVELMVGAYSDNQPDYSWMNPYEVKTFTKYWYGIRNTGGAKAANKRATLNMEFRSGNNLFIAANSTERFENVELKLCHETGQILFAKKIPVLAPETPFMEEQEILIPNRDSLSVTLTLSDSSGHEILSYHPVKRDPDKPLPETVTPPRKPEEISNIEELYLTGLRNVQFHNAFINANDYFEEALRRDPYDTRSNTQLGIYYRERGDWDKAALYLRRAIHRLTRDYTRPRDCEALYHLGLILKEQGKTKAAIDTLYRAAWDYNFLSPAYFQLAQISVGQHLFPQALKQLKQALSANTRNLPAWNLRTSLLRRMGHMAQAQKAAEYVLSIDPLNTYASYELLRINEKNRTANSDSLTTSFFKLLRDCPETYLELAVAYLNNHMPEEANLLLHHAERSQKKGLADYPTILYYLGYLHDLAGDKSGAETYFSRAVSLPTDYCFPFRLETLKVYLKALEYLPHNANTCYYLGNLLFDKQPDQAMAWWHKSIEADPNLAMAHRNLGWGYRFHVKDPIRAISAYEKAIALDSSQAIFFTELDEIYESANVDISRRCSLLSRHHETVKQRYDSYVREIRMLILSGKYDQALNYLTTDFFSRQEGVNDLHDIYVDACLLAGMEQMQKKRANSACKYFAMADQYPENQCISRSENYPRNSQIYYMTAQALRQKGQHKEANKYLSLAANNDTQNSIYTYYKALATKGLDKQANITPWFDALIEKGSGEITDYVENFFVSFGPGRTVNQVNAEAYFMIGLGYLGKGDTLQARHNFEKAIIAKKDHLWANILLKTTKNITK